VQDTQNTVIINNEHPLGYNMEGTETGKIDLTPSKRGYIRMLRLIIASSPNIEDVEWCKNELDRAGVEY
jgi:hypothetical protein